jgi:hypothetical protein
MALKASLRQYGLDVAPEGLEICLWRSVDNTSRNMLLIRRPARALSLEFVKRLGGRYSTQECGKASEVESSFDVDHDASGCPFSTSAKSIP